MKLLIILLLASLFGCGERLSTVLTPAPNGINSLVNVLSSTTSCANNGITVVSGLDHNRNNNLDTSEVSQAQEVCNGLNGNDGLDGANGQDGRDGSDAPPTPFTPVALLNPCGDNPSLNDEVLVLLSNGTLLASFSSNSSGLNTRLGILRAGTYITTDGDNCTFTLDNSGNITFNSKMY